MNDVTPPHHASPLAAIDAVAAVGEVRSTPCGSGSMTWHLFGSGRPVVFLHGGMGSWLHWIRNVPGLRRHLRMLVADIPGHMDSSLPPEPYTPESVAAILLDGVDRILGAEAPFAVVGFSFGAAIAGHVARLAGARARTLVLVSPGGLGLPRGKLPEPSKWRHLASPEARREAHRRNLQISMIRDPSHVDELAVHIHSHSVERARLVSAPVSLGATLQDCLPKVRSRIACIWGAQDPASAPYMTERRNFIRGIQPDARLTMIDDASHWVQFEQPARFDEALLASLDDPVAP